MIRQMVLKLLQKRAIFMYVMTSMTFDLMTPKSNQIIIPPTCIYDPSLKLMVLKLSWEWAINMHMTSVTFDLWPPDLIRSLSFSYAYMSQVWCWSVKRFLSYGENENGTDGWTDERPENIMSPEGGIKM